MTLHPYIGCIFEDIVEKVLRKFNKFHAYYMLTRMMFHFGNEIFTYNKINENQERLY